MITLCLLLFLTTLIAFGAWALLISLIIFFIRLFASVFALYVLFLIIKMVLF